MANLNDKRTLVYYKKEEKERNVVNVLKILKCVFYLE